MFQSTMNKWNKACDQSAVLGFVNVNLKGAGQVFFQENALTGLLFIIGIGYGAIVAGTPAVVIGAIVGLVVSTVTGTLLQTDGQSWHMGLTGYNGILVGAALTTFLGATPMLWIYLIVASAVSTVVFLAVANVFKTWGVPALTFPFNLVNWVFLLAAFEFASLHITGLGAARLPAAITAGTAHADITVVYLIEALFKNVAQVFLINNTISGVIFVIALLVSSLWVGAFALIGSAIALVASLVLGGPADAIGNGMYGFNAVLTAIALGAVFYHPSVRVFIYTVLGILTTVAIHSMMVSGLVPVSLPTGTGPFVFATWLFLLPKRNFVPVHHKKIPGGAAELAKDAGQEKSKNVGGAAGG